MFPRLPNGTLVFTIVNYTRQCQQQNAAIFKALSQRHETDMQAIMTHNAQIANGNFEMLEKHIAEALKSQSLFLEEQNEIHGNDFKIQLSGIQEAMDIENTYRDTVQTSYELATDARLTDMECRASTEREKLGQEVMEKQKVSIAMMEDKISNLEKAHREATDSIKENVSQVEGDLVNIKQILIEHMQTVLELVKQERDTHHHLVDEVAIPLLPSPQITLDIQDEEVPNWGDGEEQDEDEMEAGDQGGDEPCIIQGGNTTKQEAKTYQDSNLPSGTTDANLEIYCKQSNGFLSAEPEKQYAVDSVHVEFKKKSGIRLWRCVSHNICRIQKPTPSPRIADSPGRGQEGVPLTTNLCALAKLYRIGKLPISKFIFILFIKAKR